MRYVFNINKFWIALARSSKEGAKRAYSTYKEYISRDDLWLHKVPQGGAVTPISKTHGVFSDNGVNYVVSLTWCNKVSV